MKYTYYDVLQVTEYASPEIIRAAYLALAKKFHPDICGDDPTAAEKMKIINTAYAVLSDPDKRNRYDLLLRTQRSAENTRTQYNTANQAESAHSQRTGVYRSYDSAANAYRNSSTANQSHSAGTYHPPYVSEDTPKKETPWYVPLLVLFLMFALPIMFWLFLDFTIPVESYTKPETAADTEAEPSPPKTITYTPPEEQLPDPVPEPKTGEVLFGHKYIDASQITVTASQDASCVVKLKTAGKIDKLSFYVRAGETATVGVPDTDLYVYFASGETWYGEDLLFGENTHYSKDKRLLDFYEYTWSYTLYPVTNGNFSETPIDAEEFN